MYLMNSYDQEATTAEFGKLGVNLFFLFFFFLLLHVFLPDGPRSTYSFQDIVLKTRVVLLHLEYSLLCH